MKRLLLKEIQALGRFNKEELFKMTSYDENFKAVDYALPQGWLDSFAKFCEENSENWMENKVTYETIRSTTVYAYGNDSNHRPISFSAEVDYMLKKYNRS